MTAQRSDAIRIARVLCIVFMMTTHAWPGSERVLSIQGPWQTFYTVVVDFLGRAAVPLLSFISGLLLVYTFARKRPAAIVLSKSETLLIPMAVWSLPMIAIAYAKFRFGVGPDPDLQDPWTWLNGFLSLTSQPANGPLHFLRDIFIMSCYGIMILSFLARSRVFGTIIALSIVLIEQIPGGFLLFRNQIATMYIAGILFAYFGWANWKPHILLVLSLLGSLIALRLTGWLDEPPVDHVQLRVWEHVPRLAMSVFMWRMAIEIADWKGKPSAALLWIEPHIFVVFCSHAIIASVFGGVALAFGLIESNDIYILLFAVQIVAFLAIGVALSYLLSPLPWLRGKTSHSASRGG